MVLRLVGALRSVQPGPGWNSKQPNQELRAMLKNHQNGGFELPGWRMATPAKSLPISSSVRMVAKRSIGKRHGGGFAAVFFAACYSVSQFCVSKKRLLAWSIRAGFTEPCAYDRATDHYAGQ